MNRTEPEGQVPPKRVLVIASTYPRWKGDPEPAFVHTLCRHLDEQFHIHVLYIHSQGSATEEVMDGITIHRFRYAPAALESLIAGGGIMGNLKTSPWKWLLVPLFLSGLCIGIFRALSRVKPDLVHAHWSIPQGLALWFVGKFVRLPPIVQTSHGSDLFGLQSPLLLKLKTRAILLADQVTVVSTSMLGEAQRLRADPQRLSIAPMGVDLDSFTPSSGDVDNRISGRMLFVGRLVVSKGLCHLLSALALVCKHRPDAHLVIAGGGPELDNLRSQACELGINERVTFLGPVRHEDLPALYRQASLFVAPFIGAEGLGLVTLEAICCGCPALAGDVPAVRDIFPPEYQPEFIVNPLDTSALAQRIVRLLQDSPDISSLRNYVNNRFGWKMCASRYDDIYLKAYKKIPQQML